MTKGNALFFSLFKRLVGVIFLILNYLCYGLMIKIAADSSLSANERIIYPALVYLVSWVFVILGIYLAGPELVAKIKGYFMSVKNKIYKKNDNEA
tara:strand:- start:512 stop:796 length:285 start_codon:yes stop_codon:yes gene_type:complete